MFTISGRDIELWGTLPTVNDIARALVGMNRWGSNTIVPFSVLHHSLMMHEGMKMQKSFGTPHKLLPFFALWHDAHEFATNDIMPPFKTKEQRDLQEKIQVWLYKALLMVPGPSAVFKLAIKSYDDMCAATEAHMLCHPNVRKRFPEPADREVSLLWELLDMPKREAVQRWTSLTQHYLDMHTEGGG